jgi:hypothetical protein
MTTQGCCDKRIFQQAHWSLKLLPPLLLLVVVVAAHIMV